MLSSQSDLEALELQLLVDGLNRRYGIDFRNYAPAALQHRVRQAVKRERTSSVSALLAKVLHDERCMRRLTRALADRDGALFRHPGFFRALRRDVAPMLRTYPSVKIWVAGCATGEDAYALSILLEEEGLAERCRIYATDGDEGILEEARKGTFAATCVEEAAADFALTGGKKSLSKYFSRRGRIAKVRPGLMSNVFFTEHNPATDGSLNEFHLIVSRDLLLAFSPDVQQRIHALFYDSLCMFGFIGMGRQETFRFNSRQACYEDVNVNEKIYRKVL